jgi:NAD(P)-dependent dehydrogenase (short-subunit alcohol dehydrogenase family)
VAERFGRCDALVNNAAILYDIGARAETADLAVIHEAMETNLFGAWRTTLALLPLLRRSGRGRVVNVSSQGGSLAEMGAGTPAYHVTKAALNALTRTLAGELRSAGILVNAICPGWTATDMGGTAGRPVAAGAASVVWDISITLVIAKAPPPPPPTAPPPTAPPRNCDPSYPDVCLDPAVVDYDCEGGSGNGPEYVSGPIRVRPPDQFGLDSDGDGWGCE